MPTIFIFLIDYIAGTIERKQAVKLDNIYFSKIYTVQARGNNIVCFYEHEQEWGIAVYELGPDPVLKYFNLGMDEVSSPSLVACQNSCGV